MNKENIYITKIVIIAIMVVLLGGTIYFVCITKDYSPQSKKLHLDIPLGERAKMKDIEYTIGGFKNNRTIKIKAKNAVAKDAKVMPYISTSLKQIVHLKKVFIKSIRNDEIDIEIEARRGEYDLQKKRMKLLDIQKARFHDKSLNVPILSLILDTKLKDIRLTAGPYSIVNTSNHVIKRGKTLSGYIDEIFN